MALRIPPVPSGLAPGIGLHVVVLGIADGFILWQSLFLLEFDGMPRHEAQLRLNLWLAGGLSAIALAWLVLHVRGRLSGVSGAGLSLSAYGLLARVCCEFGMTFGGEALDWLGDAAAPVALVPWLRIGGLAAIALGVALVAAASIADRRVLRAPGVSLP